jgi:hypothetical protein
MKNELDLIADGLVVTRDSAWLFARTLSLEPAFLHPPAIMLHDLEVAKVGSLILHPPVFSRIVDVIAAQESRDIVRNIQTLDAIANTPAPMTATAAARI